MQAALTSARVTRTALGTRVLRIAFTNAEAVALEVELRRGTRTVKARKAMAHQKGSHVIRLAVPASVAAGRVTLQLSVEDAATNTKVRSRILHLPSAKR